MKTTNQAFQFPVTRLGEIMHPDADRPQEAWGVLNPGGVRAPDGTMRFHLRLGTRQVTRPSRGVLKHEGLWISYVPVDAVLADLSQLTEVGHHEHVMSGASPWEAVKIGAGAPPIRLPGGWLLPYHGVSGENENRRYSMGVAVLNLERPSRVMYQSPEPILVPETDYERGGPGLQRDLSLSR
jgi:hypothetical protein